MKNIGLLKRLGILAMLVGCLGFAAFTSGAPGSSAARCCSTCEVVPPDGDPCEYCDARCGNIPDGCYEKCITRIYGCWATCDFGC